jgi:hypothetical protein
LTIHFQDIVQKNQNTKSNLSTWKQFKFVSPMAFASRPTIKIEKGNMECNSQNRWNNAGITARKWNRCRAMKMGLSNEIWQVHKSKRHQEIR